MEQKIEINTPFDKINNNFSDKQQNSFLLEQEKITNIKLRAIDEYSKEVSLLIEELLEYNKEKNHNDLMDVMLTSLMILNNPDIKLNAAKGLYHK